MAPLPPHIPLVPRRATLYTAEVRARDSVSDHRKQASWKRVRVPDVIRAQPERAGAATKMADGTQSSRSFSPCLLLSLIQSAAIFGFERTSDSVKRNHCNEGTGVLEFAETSHHSRFAERGETPMRQRLPPHTPGHMLNLGANNSTLQKARFPKRNVPFIL